MLLLLLNIVVVYDVIVRAGVQVPVLPRGRDEVCRDEGGQLSRSYQEPGTADQSIHQLNNSLGNKNNCGVYGPILKSFGPK